MIAGRLVRGATVPVLEPVAARVVPAVPVAVIAGSGDGPGASDVAARLVRALVDLGRAPDVLVVSARAREGAELDAQAATADASESVRLLRAAGAGSVSWLRAHPASVEAPLRSLVASLPAGRPLVVVGALALAVVAPRLSVLVTAAPAARPDPQARAVEPLCTLSVSDASDSLVAGLASLLAG